MGECTRYGFITVTKWKPNCSKLISYQNLALGRWVFNATHRPIYPWEIETVSILQEDKWASRSFRTGMGNLFFTDVESSYLPVQRGVIYWLRYSGR